MCQPPKCLTTCPTCINGRQREQQKSSEVTMTVTKTGSFNSRMFSVISHDVATTQQSTWNVGRFTCEVHGCTWVELLSASKDRQEDNQAPQTDLLALKPGSKRALAGVKENQCHATRKNHVVWDTLWLPSLDRGSREAKVPFEPRTFWSQTATAVGTPNRSARRLCRSLLTGSSVVRTRPQHLHRSNLGLVNLAVPQP
ncbi:hypothetical protein CSKR_110891 [Clonorchis sinensis]|uniref:Uncharacterized protein n=1 Tax=Clonorchis sinensis TaxID=79923 RepID=A0A3R7F8P7_CLOSI|nr:hypothetical protein CSKR_110891 [Clonorchis sinensis]